jgi:hypothetical protein
MGRSSHKTTREREGQQVYPPAGDGLKTLLTEKAVSEELRVYLEQIIGFIGDPSAEHPIACPLSIQPDKEPIPGRPRKLKLSEVNLFIHPMAELLAHIVATNPTVKPRGRSKKDEPNGVEPPTGLANTDFALPSEYFDEQLLQEDLKGRPLRCLELGPHKYLYIDSVRRLDELQRHGYRNLPFLIAKPSQDGSWDQAIMRSFRRVFESFREDPCFLSPVVRRRLINVLLSVGLLPVVFKSLPLSEIYKVMQISSSTTRAGRSKSAE